jgi:hypothetical protein
MRLMTGRHLTAVSEETVEVEPVWRDSRQLVRMLCASVARTPRVAERERSLYGQRVEGCVVSIRGGGLFKGCPVTWARVGWSAGRWCRRG